ncbi:radical SAM protein [Paraeggerthella sp.]|uniref:radical SAM protein n=1 Tax=Paraeggerthella sp. TaxID=2897350 RepID=UPI003AB6E2DD
MRAADQIKRAAMMKTVGYLLEDPDKNITKIMDMIDKVAPEDLFRNQRNAFRTAIDSKNNWYQLIMRILEKMNPEVRDALVKNLVVDGNLMAWPFQEEMRKKHRCNIPWAILLDPTSACNLSCTGCWAAEYGHKLNLTYDDIDSIVRQGKELGCHIYIYTGGEPLVRKKDLIRLCKAHSDCSFLCFTNATLIDEDFCQDLLHVKNFVPSISAEGTRETTDARRGKGTYDKVVAAMALLKSHGLPFGISACITSQNADAIGSEEFVDWMIEQGALFCWIFNYMPVGMDAPAELMLTVEQRKRMYGFVRRMREEKPLFLMDFQNDGEFVGGCIAGGRRYLHINAAGDVEPCVFIHYSNANIHDMSLLECLKSPLFMQYYEGQPFNDNLLRPCPMLENPGCLEAMVEASGAHPTDLHQFESAEHLCGKCRDFARAWEPVAEELWTDQDDARYPYRKDISVLMSSEELNKFAKQGRELRKL